ncbi:kinase-like domain-containing protein [Nemania sp. NC0429]|nr:kinase-like domain-containing protein [Nemania sp. NC0429]KAI1109909.1 kinase-like domain-containing protein [Nemania sp. NC0429]
MTSIQYDDSDPSVKTQSSVRPSIFPWSDNPRPRKVNTARLNLVTFLAVLQYLEVPTLSITWDSEKKPIGGGRTGRIAESSLKADSGLAFKRIGDEEKARDAGNEIFLPLIKEIAILRHRHIDGHPNINELQGISWDITPKSHTADETAGLTRREDAFNIWPVLVFQKSEYGDLHQFATSPEGRKLSISDRLQLCVDVGNVLATMQSHHIIHGDVKPQNVLIYGSESQGALVMAKMIDFGFSFWHSDDETRIPVPRSWPWYAPECDEYPDFTPLEARKTDVFSYGMLCLWLLTEARLSNSQLRLNSTPNTALYRSDVQGAISSLELIATLKDQHLLQGLVNELLVEEPGIKAQSKVMLEKFFSTTLAYDPTSRCSGIQEALRFLDIDEARRTAYPSALYLAYPDRMRRLAGKTIDPIEVPPATDNEFNICNSLHALYSSDYRLRRAIVECLREVTANDSASIALRIQLSLCRKLGFGGPIAEDGNLGVCDDTSFKDELSEMLSKIANSDNDEFKYQGSYYGLMNAMGYSIENSLADSYVRANVLEAAEATTRFEISHIEKELGPDHWISLLLGGELISIVGVQGRDTEAEQMEGDLVQRMIKTLGRLHPDTLHRMSMLESRYSKCGKLEDAERLAIEVADLHIELYGKQSPLTIEKMAEMGRVYYLRDKLKEAEAVFTEVVSIDEREPGDEFPYTIGHMGELAIIYKAQGKFEEAERVLLQIISWREGAFGLDDRQTLISVRRLASLYRETGQEEEARALLETHSIT